MGSNSRDPRSYAKAALEDEDIEALELQAEEQDRPRAAHCGIIVRGIVRVAEGLVAEERARLDYLLRHPAELLPRLRPALQVGGEAQPVGDLPDKSAPGKRPRRPGI